MTTARGRRLIFDIETDGLLRDVTTVWSLVIRDADTGEQWSCTDHGDPAVFYAIDSGLARLEHAAEVIGHNIVAFDLPALRKVYPTFALRPDCKVTDTLVAARLRFTAPHLRQHDYLVKKKRPTFPLHLAGSHTLEAWGYRVGVLKGDFGKTSDWSAWTPAMQAYCEQDVTTTAAVYAHIKPWELPALAMEIETTLAEYLALQELNGVVLDYDRVLTLHAALLAERVAIDETIRERMPLVVVPGKPFVPKRDNKKLGYVAGAACTKIDIEELNPGSRHHLALALKARFGWTSPSLTETGQPQIDDDILAGAASIPEDVREPLRRRFLLSKRIGQIADGKEAWTQHARFAPERNAHFIHHRCKTDGTITHRAAHANPNLAQVPRVGKPFGVECRSCFTVLPGWTMVGADASGLELRCLAHYLAKYDGGAYGNTVIHGRQDEGTDVHSRTRDALGLAPTKENRDVSKTWIYAYLYGAGDQKLGSILHPEASEEKQRRVGKKLRKAFETRLPGVAQLRAAIDKVVARGYLVMPDGRHTQVRSAHAALNSLLQSAGAIICKLWITRLYPKLVAKLGAPSWDGQWTPMLWIHDEVQLACRPEHAEWIAQTCAETIREVGAELQWRCPLDGEAHIGQTWADTH